MADIKFEVPKDLADKALSILASSKKVRRGTNEITKVVERKLAKLVIIAEDISPPEIVAHLPILCNEKDIPFIYVPRKDELGKAAGLSVSTAAAAIIDEGEGKKILSEVVSKLSEIRTGKKSAAKKEEAPKAEKKEEKKAEEKPAKEEKKEEKVKEEKPAKEEKKKEEPEEKKEEPAAEEAAAEESKEEEKPAEEPVEEKPAEEAPAEEKKE